MSDRKKSVFQDEELALNRYIEAEKFEHEYGVESLVINSQIYPNWIKDTCCFWYIKKIRVSVNEKLKIIKQVRIVDAENATNTIAFNHELLASHLSHKTKRMVDFKNLPITNIKIQLSPFVVYFTALNGNWKFDGENDLCKVTGMPLDPFRYSLSPDGTKAAFVRAHNIWIRDVAKNQERPLTTDGVSHFAYGGLPERTNLIGGLLDAPWDVKPEVLWSPDSQRLLVTQVDERQVGSLPVTLYAPRDGSVRPRCTMTKYALPGDNEIATYKVKAINVDTGYVCAADYSPLPDSVLHAGLVAGNRVWWGKDSSYAYFLDMNRGQQEVSVVEFNTESGATRVIFKETSDSYIDLNLDYEFPAIQRPLPETMELIWFSERSGWAHLYLYDLVSGKKKVTITKGEWLVRDILYLDVNRREVIIQAAGRVKSRDPYYREILRINIDSGVIDIVASSDHDFIVRKPGSLFNQIAVGDGRATLETSGVSPDGNYIVATRTRADEASSTILFNLNGQAIQVVESADTEGLPDGWGWPEAFSTLAEDKKTRLYGLVFRPTDFDVNKKYPVINFVVNSPFYSIVPKGSFGTDSESVLVYPSATALSELGFVVVLLDARGSCYRSKSFHDESYGQKQVSSKIEDHVAAIKELADTYSYMDINRVGILDNCSNSAAYALMKYPDFYKVGVAVSNWDARLLAQGETYCSHSDQRLTMIEDVADNLKGKLLIMHGMLDPFFHVSGVFQLVDVLIRFNKDFDLILIPNGYHGSSRSDHYGRRRVWDYFLKNLLHIDPPNDFRLSSGQEYLEAMQAKEFD